MMDNEFYFSIDVGGTDIKGGVVTADGKILTSTKIPTDARSFKFDLATSIIALINKLETISGYKLKDSLGLGIALPGLIDNKRGILRHSGNLRLVNYPLLSKLEKVIDVPIKIENDADVATLAELHFGAGKQYSNFVMVTVGTGIGGGAVIGGKALSSFCNYSCEIGHMKVTDEKVLCTCGKTGCFEAMASARALTIMLKDALCENQESKILKDFTLSEVTAKTVFDYLGKDKVADKVFDEYITNLGNGIVNLVNIFAPEAIVLGGAISAQKNVLTKPLEKYVNKNIYAAGAGKEVKIITAKETGNAGILGAMCLFLN